MSLSLARQTGEDAFAIPKCVKFENLTAALQLLSLMMRHRHVLRQ
jgi:hypothetical protein